MGRTRSGQTPRQTLGQLTLDLRLQALIRLQVFQVLLAELFTHVYTWRSDDELMGTSVATIPLDLIDLDAPAQRHCLHALLNPSLA